MKIKIPSANGIGLTRGKRTKFCLCLKIYGKKNNNNSIILKSHSHTEPLEINGKRSVWGNIEHTPPLSPPAPPSTSYQKWIMEKFMHLKKPVPVSIVRFFRKIQMTNSIPFPASSPSLPHLPNTFISLIFFIHWPRHLSPL